MELARLYPKWVSGTLCGPQFATSTVQPVQLLTLLKGSLLHRGSLTDLWGTDYPGTSQGRIQLSWSIWSYLRGIRYLIQGKVKFTALSVVHLWPSAVWFEREVWEILGIYVEGHPDLRRLLTDYGFNGLPLTKDFPCVGYTEVRFSERAKRVVLRGVHLTQEFRTFDFTSPWES